MTPQLVSVLLRILVVLLTTLLAVALAERAVGVLQKRYLARVRMQIRGLSPGEPAPSLEALTTMVTSPAVLAPALQALGKDTSEDALRQWRRAVSVRGIRDTELAQIGVTATVPIDAANLANAIVEEFASQRRAAQQAAVDQTLASLRGEIAALRMNVETLRGECRQMRAESDILDFWPDATDGSVVPLIEALPKLNAQIAQARELQEKLSALTDDEVLEEMSQETAFGNSLDPMMTKLSLELKQAISQEEKLAAAGTNDASLQLARDRKARLQKQLSELVTVLRARVATQLSIAESKLELVKQTGLMLPKKDGLEKYGRAKTRYVEEKKRLEDLERKFAAEKMDAVMVRTPAHIWEIAEPPTQAETTPYLILAITLLVGLAVGTGLAFVSRPGVTVLVLLVLLLAVLASFRFPSRAAQGRLPANHAK